MLRHARLRLLMLITAAALLAWFTLAGQPGGASEAGIVEAANSVRRGPAEVKSASASRSSGLLARRSLAESPGRDLFAATSWVPPAPAPAIAPAAPPPPPPPPAAPKAPPVPFGFVGLLEDRARPKAFLSKGDELIVVSAGDTLDNAYHVDSLNANEIILTYLPLKQRQSILISGGQ